MRSTIRQRRTAATHRRTAGRYWQLAEAAEKTGRITRAREFVTLALSFDRRAAGIAAPGDGRPPGPAH